MRWLSRILAVLGAWTLAVFATPSNWYGQFLASPWTDTRGQTIILLGSSSLSDGSLDESGFWRGNCAAKIWSESASQQILLSGTPGETAAMTEYLRLRGVPLAAIVKGNPANSTRENALNTARIVGQYSGPLLLVTSDFHTWRAHRAFTKAGVTTSPRPCPDAFKRSTDWRDRPRVFLDIALELVKIGYYRFRRWA